jgi:hypothetical protein
MTQTKLSPTERIVRELLIQDYWVEADWNDVDPEEIDTYLAVPGIRARYERKAARLTDAVATA